MNISENAEKRMAEAELFTRRFGTFTKSDYEVLMFTIYLDSMDEPVRDYDVSIALGITESKVRNLRIRSQLLYPKDIIWQRELAESIEHGYYDTQTSQITITFENPSIQSMVKNIIEKNFGTVGQSLNVKQLVLPVESFLLLAAYAEQEPDRVIRELNRAVQADSENTSKIEKKSFRHRFLQSISDLPGFLSLILSIYQSGRPIIESIIHTIQ